VTSGQPVHRAKCISDGARVGAKIARALFSLFVSFFLFFLSFLPSLKEKRTLEHDGAYQSIRDGWLKRSHTPNAEELDGIRCTKRFTIIPIITTDTCKGA